MTSHEKFVPMASPLASQRAGHLSWSSDRDRATRRRRCCQFQGNGCSLFSLVDGAGKREAGIVRPEWIDGPAGCGSVWSLVPTGVPVVACEFGASRGAGSERQARLVRSCAQAAGTNGERKARERSPRCCGGLMKSWDCPGLEPHSGLRHSAGNPCPRV
jgi:hypothetical protein